MLYLILALLIWASSLIVGKYSYDVFDPVLVVQLRLIVSALLVAPVFIKSYRQIPSHLRTKVWFLALLNFPVVLLLQFIGLYYTSASSAVTIIGAEPLLVVMLGHLFFSQPAKKLDWILGIVAFIGIAVMVSGSNHGGTHSEISLFGCLLVFGGTVAFSLCMLLGKNVMKEVNHTAYTNVILVLGMVLCIPFTLLLTKDWNIEFGVTSVGAILYLGIACSWLAYTLFNKGLKMVNTNVSAILITLEPVFGVLLAIALLGESLSINAIIGIVLVIAASIVSVIKRAS